MARQWRDLAPLRPLTPASEPAYAHTPNEEGRWHSFKAHSARVGDLAAEFASAFGGESIAHFLGLTHDAGKLTQEVQEALRLCDLGVRRHLGVPHKVEGGGLGWLLRGNPDAFQVATLANFGHHHQLPASSQFERIEEDLEDDPHLLDPLIDRLREVLCVDLVAEAEAVSLPTSLDGARQAERRRNRELFVRMVHSALVDADFLDTEAHFKASEWVRLREHLGMAVLRDHFDHWYSQQRFDKSTNDDLNRLRQQTFQASIAAATDATIAAQNGIYRLPAPTGSGKTLATAAFALHHAAKFGKRRVIIAVPYTSITTQNAAVYRAIFEDLHLEVVLEHHSNVEDPDIQEDSWRRLTAENWDAEFIVTTTVQLFESVFKGKPAASRKLHRIAGSVVVLDEVQALPLHVLPTILMLLRQLVEQYDVTVLLASATQPTFWSLGPWSGDPAEGGIPMTCHDIVPIDHVPDVAQRVTYEVRKHQQSWEELAVELSSEPQALVIANTTSHAQELHALLEQNVPGTVDVLHLSTRMCAQHRFDVLDEVERLLQAESPVLLVSTQLIEAGVDVDFPVVYRALAPAESLVQSAGRCNREGKLGVRGGRVVVFEPEDPGIPGGHYADAASLTRDMFVNEGRHLDSPADLADYFKAFYRRHVPRDMQDEIDALRLKFDFPAVADAFRMIKTPTASAVVTEYGDNETRRIISDILDGLEGDPRRLLTRDERRLLQRYSATLPRHGADPLVEVVAPGVLRWSGEYDPSRGIVLDGGLTTW
ncbi:MAG: CRISPR-associated helicase Cas3' [Nocardioides sp.]|uniref:CRISPR-associated helicase Cas3' n=1 Tax=Nocardioides sp. TaxID=35761 RepID=UPI0039E560D0